MQFSPFLLIIAAANLSLYVLASSESIGYHDTLEFVDLLQRYHDDDQPGRYSDQLMDHCISSYTHGTFNNALDFIQSITSGLYGLISDDESSELEYHSNIDYFMISSSPLPQPGCRLRLWSTTPAIKYFATTDSDNSENSSLLVDLMFGCKGQRYDGEALGRLKLSSTPQPHNHCVPVVTIEHIRIQGQALQSRRFSSHLLLNLIETMERIRRVAGGSLIANPPQINVLALTRPDLKYTGAAFWARKGFRFKDERERVKLITSFIEWLREEYLPGRRVILSTGELNQLRSHLINTVKRPADFMDDNVDFHHFIPPTSSGQLREETLGLGKRFMMSTERATWEGHLLIDDGQDNSVSTKQQLLLKSQKNSGRRYKALPPTPAQMSLLKSHSASRRSQNINNNLFPFRLRRPALTLV